MNRPFANLYRDALEKWHRCKRELPSLDHDALFPRSEDYHLPDQEAEHIRLEVQRQFERSE